jgi:hypothetical protein
MPRRSASPSSGMRLIREPHQAGPSAASLGRYQESGQASRSRVAREVVGKEDERGIPRARRALRSTSGRTSLRATGNHWTDTQRFNGRIGNCLADVLA